MSIAWKLDVNITDVLGRWWTFLPKNDYLFADIIRDEDVIEMPQYSPGPFAITKPSTLILKNVTIQCNGTYTFSIYANNKSTGSNVTVFVAGKCRLYIILYLFYPAFAKFLIHLFFEVLTNWFRQVQ